MSEIPDLLFDELLSLLQSKELDQWSTEQQKRLEDLLRSSSEARQLYLKMTHDHTSFHWLAHEHGERVLPHIEALPKQVQQSHIREQKSPKSTTWLQSPVLAWAATLLMALGLGMLLYEKYLENLDPIDVTSVAVLTRSVDAMWDGMQHSPENNTPLQPGLLKLKSGLAQIDFYCGASLVLEGPAELKLLSADQAYLNFGKLRSYVPEHAKGFTVKLKESDVIDLGTEFALQVDPNGNSELHVIDGEVKLREQGHREQHLEGGKALMLHEPGSHLEIPINEAAFVGFKSLYHLSDKSHQHRYKQWNHLRHRISNDQQALLYFSFENQNSWDREIINLAPNQISNGAIVGCRWSEGRWPGKKAIEFNGVADRIRVDIPGEFRQLSFVAWVKFSHLKNKLNSLLLTDSWSQGKLHWQVSRDKEMVMGVHNHRNYVSKPNTLSEGQWLLLTSIYDLNTQSLKHYINAELKSQSQLKKTDVVTIGQASIGNWMNVDGMLVSNRDFTGIIDEFMVLKRVLSENEIREMYQVGRPN
jgi:hypothetical protein